MTEGATTKLLHTILTFRKFEKNFLDAQELTFLTLR